MSSKRLLFIVHSLVIGGTESLVLKMAEALLKDFTVGICCLDAEADLWSHAREKGIALYCLHRKPGWHLKTFVDMTKVLEDFKPDIIHAHQYTPYFYSVAAKVLTFSHAKLIFTEHGRHYPDQVKFIRKLFNQILLCFTDEVTAVSNFTRERLYHSEGIRFKSIHLIYNGILNHENSQQKKDIRQELNIPSSVKIVGFIGGLRPVKNPFFLLRAFSRVVKKEPNAVLIYVGEGALKKEIARMAETLGIQNKVYLPGAYYPGEAYLPSFDVFVLPSFSEATSLALLEAMSQGVPVIVTDRGGSPEIVEDGKTGYIVKCDDDDALANTILKIIMHPNESMKLTNQAKQFVNQRFQFEQMMKQYLELYAK